jgi:hypothetical protein
MGDHGVGFGWSGSLDRDTKPHVACMDFESSRRPTVGRLEGMRHGWFGSCIFGIQG